MKNYEESGISPNCKITSSPATILQMTAERWLITCINSSTSVFTFAPLPESQCDVPEHDMKVR
jgi:hypothetical protein